MYKCSEEHQLIATKPSNFLMETSPYEVYPFELVIKNRSCEHDDAWSNLPLETIMGNQLAVVFKTFRNCQCALLPLAGTQFWEFREIWEILQFLQFLKFCARAWLRVARDSKNTTDSSPAFAEKLFTNSYNFYNSSWQLNWFAIFLSIIRRHGFLRILIFHSVFLVIILAPGLATPDLFSQG